MGNRKIIFEYAQLIMIIAHNNWMSMGKNYSLLKNAKIGQIERKNRKNFDTCISCQIRGGEEKEKEKVAKTNEKERPKRKKRAKMPLRLEAEREKVSFGPKLPAAP